MEDWKATLAEVMAKRRRELGERPSTGELVALLAGELSRGERERLLDRAAWDPEVARDLRELLHLLEPADGEVGPGKDADLDRRWQAMRSRLVAERVLPPTPVLQPAPPELPRARSWRWLPLAASFAVGVIAAMAVWQLRTSVGPRSPGGHVEVNLPIVELEPTTSGPRVDTRRGGEITLVPVSSEGLVLTLTAPGVAPGSGPYDLAIRRDDREIFHSRQLVPAEGGMFVLFLPRDRLASGPHEILLRDRGGSTVASYRLEVSLAQ